jgi:hypothetical protein
MSAPNLKSKETEYLSLGFMANGAYTALDALLAGKPIVEYQSQSLKDAAAFMEEVSSAAEFITGGRLRRGVDASQAVGALRFALGPRESLRQMMADDNFAGFFSEITDAVEKASNGSNRAQDRRKLKRASEFFRAFHDWLVSERNVRRPVLGGRRTRGGSAAFR